MGYEGVKKVININFGVVGGGGSNEVDFFEVGN